MQPDSPAFEDDDSQSLPGSPRKFVDEPIAVGSDKATDKKPEQIVEAATEQATEETTEQAITEAARQEIAQLEATKAQLTSDIENLKRDYEQLNATVQQRRSADKGSSVLPSALPSVRATQIEAARPAANYIPAKPFASSTLSAGPRLPGEPAHPPLPEPKSAEPTASSLLAGLQTPAESAEPDAVEPAVTEPDAVDLAMTQTDASDALKAAQPQASLLIPMPRLPGERLLPKTVVSKINSKMGARAKEKSKENASTQAKTDPTTKVPTAVRGSAVRGPAVRGPIELPIPSTSEQRRQRYLQRRAEESSDADKVSVMPRRGVILSAIAACMMAWHFCVVSALGQGGSWLGFPIAQLGTGFVPAVAVLWLRMLVMVPALMFLAPQLYRYTWEDLQDWIYTRDRLLGTLIGSGVALFLSQVLIYQCVGLVGPAIGVMLLFLYPLTAVPLGAVVAPDRRPSPLGLLALVAIAMGGILAIRPVLSRLPVGNDIVGAVSDTANGAVGDAIVTASSSAIDFSSPIVLGLVASLAFSVYIVLTNLSYRQQHCHPMPVAIVQFSTVAVLSSIVLLVRPLNPVAISWLSFSLWGILLGLVMLIVYLFSYSSLRLIGVRTAIVTAATPLAALLIAWSFMPQPTLLALQWTGIVLVTIGGIAFGQEKLNNFRP